jgi:5-bromo-4-chloroindolyl phosphate hydrolysis protein
LNIDNNYQGKFYPSVDAENPVKSIDNSYQSQEAAVTLENLPKAISDTLNEVVEKHPEYKKIDLEARPITVWGFKITLYQKD